MSEGLPEEQFTEQRVTYTLQAGENFIVVENVPARVSTRTGERFFTPETIERLQTIAWGEAQPVRVLTTQVF